MDKLPEIKQFIKAGLTSVFCLGLFYPLEIAKLKLQTNQPINLPIKNFYKGISKSCLLVFFEKGIKFTTFNYCINNNYSFFNSIFITTLSQSIISNPIEYYRINYPINFFNYKMYKGIHFTISRDIVFNYLLFKLAFNKTDFISNLKAGIVATCIATPIDVIKTNFQQGHTFKNICHKIYKNPSFLIKGIIPRTLSIGGFYGMTYFILQNLSKYY